MFSSRKIRVVLSFMLAAFLGGAFASTAGAGPNALGPCGTATEVLTQSDGKTIFTAATRTCGSWMPEGDSRPVIARLGVDGRIDSGYGDGGTVSLPVAQVLDAALTGTGRLLVAMSDGVRAYTADGNPDQSFGVNGFSKQGVYQDQLTVTPSEISISPQGRIFVAGNDRGVGPWSVQALLPNGSPDPSFNGGTPYYPIVEGQAEGAATSGSLAFDEAGAVFVAFTFSSPGSQGGPQYGLAARKLGPSGVPDQGYGVDGLAIIPDAQWKPRHYGGGEVQAATALPDGSLATFVTQLQAGELYFTPFTYRIQIGPDGGNPQGGQSYTPMTEMASIGGGRMLGTKPYFSQRGIDDTPEDLKQRGRRILANGENDSSFGYKGVAGTLIGLRADSAAVAAAGDGMVLAGSASAHTCGEETIVRCDRVIALSKYDSTGQLVSGFGKDGVVTFPDIHCPLPEGANGCRHGDQVAPRVKAAFTDRRLSRLVVKVSPNSERPNQTEPWNLARVNLPAKLAVKPAGLRRVRVFAGLGQAAPRVPARKLDVVYGNLKIERSSVQVSNSLRVVIPRRALKPIGKRLRGRSLKVEAIFGWNGGAALSGWGRVRVPRR